MNMEYWENFKWEVFIGDTLVTIGIVASAIVIWMILSRALRTLARKAKLSSSAVLPLRIVLRWSVVLISLLLILSSYGIPIGNFWTFVSTIIGLVAIGFVAVWSVLSNISSTFLLLLIQPFKVGDYVKLVGDDVMGRVLGINFMYTTVRKSSGDVFKVPNNQFFQKSILRPADPRKLEASEDGDADKGEGEAKESPHKNENLEGIHFPGGAETPAKR